MLQSQIKIIFFFYSVAIYTFSFFFLNGELRQLMYRFVEYALQNLLILPSIIETSMQLLKMIPQFPIYPTFPFVQHTDSFSPAAANSAALIKCQLRATLRCVQVNLGPPNKRKHNKRILLGPAFHDALILKGRSVTTKWFNALLFTLYFFIKTGQRPQKRFRQLCLPVETCALFSCLKQGVLYITCPEGIFLRFCIFRSSVRCFLQTSPCACKYR